eukprot:3156194-Pleurochrysis_carterae.AAC.1
MHAERTVHSRLSRITRPRRAALAEASSNRPSVSCHQEIHRRFSRTPQRLLNPKFFKAREDHRCIAHFTGML